MLLMLLKLYTSSAVLCISTVVMNKSYEFFTLNTPSLCTYHLLDRSTQQKSCEVENAIFSDIFYDSTNRSNVALIFTGDSVLNRTLAE